MLTLTVGTGGVQGRPLWRHTVLRSRADGDAEPAGARSPPEVTQHVGSDACSARTVDAASWCSVSPKMRVGWGRAQQEGGSVLPKCWWVGCFPETRHPGPSPSV